jgi:hypothetical protein
MTEFKKSSYGVTTSETCVAGLEMLQAAGGDFNVIKRQLSYGVESPAGVTGDGQMMMGTEHKLIDAYVACRDDTNAHLSSKTVGEGYEVLQNREVIEMVDAICGDHNLTYTNLTTLSGGAGLCVQVMCPDLNKALKVGSDEHDGRLTITNKHDGSGSVTSHISLLRLFCSNVVPALRREMTKLRAKDSRSVYRIKHTKTMQERIACMVETYRAAMGDMVFTADIMRKLAGKKCSENEMKDLFKRVIAADGKDETELSEAAKTKRAGKYADLLSRSKDSINIPQGLGDTWYGAMQAITDFGTRGMTVKNTKAVNKDEGRFLSQNFGAGSEFSLEGLRIAMELTGVS